MSSDLRRDRAAGAAGGMIVDPAAAPFFRRRVRSAHSSLSAHGEPWVWLTGGALARLEALTPPGHTARIDLTITDDFPLAQAVVIISAVPAELAAHLTAS